jgi:hypothetical protein
MTHNMCRFEGMTKKNMRTIDVYGIDVKPSYNGPRIPAHTDCVFLDTHF